MRSINDGKELRADIAKLSEILKKSLLEHTKEDKLFLKAVAFKKYAGDRTILHGTKYFSPQNWFENYFLKSAALLLNYNCKIVETKDQNNNDAFMNFVLENCINVEHPLSHLESFSVKASEILGGLFALGYNNTVYFHAGTPYNRVLSSLLNTKYAGSSAQTNYIRVVTGTLMSKKHHQEIEVGKDIIKQSFLHKLEILYKLKNGCIFKENHAYAMESHVSNLAEYKGIKCNIILSATEFYLMLSQYKADFRLPETIFRNAVQFGADIDFRDGKHGYAPLMLAARAENLQLVKSLYEYGADLYAKDREGETPLSIILTNPNNLLIRALKTLGVFDKFDSKEERDEGRHRCK